MMSVAAARVAEAAAVGAAHELLGQAITVFVSLRESTGVEVVDPAQIQRELIEEVRHHIGPFSAPTKVYVVSDLPKTRSGKIMRRCLRKMLEGEVVENLGDVSTVSCLLAVFQNCLSSESEVPSLRGLTVPLT